MSIQDTIAYEEHSINFYILNNSNEFISSIKKYIKINKKFSKSEFKVEQKEERKEKWTNKVMHRKFTRQIENFSLKKSWQWLKRGCLKRQTESRLIAAQDKALGINYRKARIERSRESAKCRMYKEKDETVTHLISECSKLAQKAYKRRHDKVATAVHRSILKTNNLPHSKHWYEHKAEAVMENEKVKILFNFNIYVDKLINARRPDIVVIKNDLKECYIIDIAIPGNIRTEIKEKEKIDNYQELSRLWKVRTTVILVVTGALGTITNKLTYYFKLIGVNISFETIQKSALLGSGFILRKVLGRSQEN